MVAKLGLGSFPSSISYLLAKIHMVAKHSHSINSNIHRYLLAKIHMVAKRYIQSHAQMLSYLLAKIHMVAKLYANGINVFSCYLLAKIHMVAKLLYSSNVFRSGLSSSKNPYGSKTHDGLVTSGI